jgi:hypothetical protein
MCALSFAAVAVGGARLFLLLALSLLSLVFSSSVVPYPFD